MKWRVCGARSLLCLPFGQRPHHVYRLKKFFKWYFLWDIGHEKNYPEPKNIGISADGSTWYTRMMREK